jgi:hypothetical protein
MANVKAVMAGKAALRALENNYFEYNLAITAEGEYAHGKCYRQLKEIRRLAGKVGENMKRCGRPSKFLDVALTAYDYSDAMILGTTSLPELDRKAAICSAAMEVVREALRYECDNGALKIAIPSLKLTERSFAESLN